MIVFVYPCTLRVTMQATHACNHFIHACRDVFNARLQKGDGVGVKNTRIMTPTERQRQRAFTNADDILVVDGDSKVYAMPSFPQPSIHAKSTDYDVLFSTATLSSMMGKTFNVTFVVGPEFKHPIGNQPFISTPWM